MKYCSKCGKELFDEAVICVNCGCAVDNFNVKKEQTSAVINPNVKYCSKCGKQLMAEAVVCINCGCATEPLKKQNTKKGLSSAIKVFMIFACFFPGVYIIPLAWTIPMVISYFRKVENNEKIGIGFKICTLLFCNTIAGILMLCDNDN
jgi:hypothetical protein